MAEVIRFPPRPRAPVSRAEVLELGAPGARADATETAREDGACGDFRTSDDLNVVRVREERLADPDTRTLTDPQNSASPTDYGVPGTSAAGPRWRHDTASLTAYAGLRIWAVSAGSRAKAATSARRLH